MEKGQQKKRDVRQKWMRRDEDRTRQRKVRWDGQRRKVEDGKGERRLEGL